MTLIEFCDNLKKEMRLPRDLHVAAVFEDNGHDDIVGWTVLDSKNSRVTGVIPSEDLKEWGKYRIQGTI